MNSGNILHEIILPCQAGSQTESDYVKLSFLPRLGLSIWSFRECGTSTEFLLKYIFTVFCLDYHEYHLTILNLNNKEFLCQFIKMRNYLNLKRFHGHYINISIQRRVGAHCVRQAGRAGRKNDIFIAVVAINLQI